MEYKITQKQLTCINILIKILEEAITRDTFEKDEVEKIIKTVETLCKN